MSADYDIADLFDEGLYHDFGDENALPPTVAIEPEIHEAFFERSQYYWMQSPIPPGAVPVGENPLASVADEVLLSMCPSLIIQVQRAAASGGMQVISPRDTSLAASFSRTAHTSRTTDMFLVGSIASRNTEWPTIDGTNVTTRFNDPSIDAYPSSIAIRPRVRTAGVMSASDRSGDPVLTAYLTGRALVDLQRRTDVGGSSVAVSSAIAASWGVASDVFDADAEATIAPQGDLLRYAIRADEAYPMLNAPVDSKKCISVGANTAGRQLYGEYAAIDWRRLRVGMEAVFYMTSRVENYNLAQLACDVPPGDPRASPNRSGILQFRPMPGSVWSYDPGTFRIDPPGLTTVRRAAPLPARVTDAAASFYQDARPLSIAARSGVPVNLIPTSSATVHTHTAEALVTGYKVVLSSASTFSVRGRTAVAATRDYLYQALSEVHTIGALMTLWTVRYLADTVQQMGLTHIADASLTKKLAARMTEYMSDVRVKLAAAACARGEDLDTWWGYVSSMLPADVKPKAEGTSAWAVASAHFLLHPYSHKWTGLRTALSHRAVEAMPNRRSRAIRLPSELRSPARVYEAACADARSLAATYGAYYSASRDACDILALRCHAAGLAELHARFVMAALMWDIRAKAASSVRVHREDGTSAAAGHHGGSTGSYHITTAPYAAYRRWYDSMMASRRVPPTVKRSYTAHTEGHVSEMFKDKTAPIMPMSGIPAARLLRYILDPSKLATDMERTLEEMMTDISATIDHYEAEANEAPSPRGDSVPVAQLVSPVHITSMRPHETSFWAILGTLEPELALAIEEDVAAAPDTVREAIEGGMFNSSSEMLSAYRAMMDNHQLSRAPDPIS
jgi:hypothetical protein